MRDYLTLADHLWAKTGRNPDTHEITHWLPLPTHLFDTGEVAVRLLHHRVSPQQRRVLTASLPADVELECLVRFLGASHDLGKSGPAFQGQVDQMAGQVLRRTQDLFDDPDLALNTHDAEPVASQGEFPHSLASEIILARVLGEDYGLQRRGKVSPLKKQGVQPVEVDINHQLSSIAGAHHGMSTPEAFTRKQIRQKPWPTRLGLAGSPWPHVQRALAHRIIDTSGTDFASPVWKDPDFTLDQAVLSLLTGLVIQADWIASNQDVFPLIELEEDIDFCAPTQERVDHAWRQLRLPAQWRPASVPSADAALHHRFDLPDAAKPRPGQSAAFNATKDITEPALLILEDETGAGKTEAALLAAENLAQATGATGVFIGLPTQATTNAIFTRVAEWLRHVESYSADSQVSVALAHGKSLLNRTYRNMPRIRPKDASDTAELSDALDFQDPPPQTSAECQDTPSGNQRTKILRPGTHDWLSGRKKRILADFVVGTVDQLLMASLKARHVMLRHSGFANKVVIIDEAHAADTTMKVFMRGSLEWLGRLGAPTIILTATLPPAQKTELLEAYRRGLRQRAAAQKLALAGETDNIGDDTAAAPSAPTAAPKYPVLTVATGTSVTETEFPGRPNRSVALQELADDDSALVATVRELIAEGGCIAVIRNSVKRVQHTAQLLREAFGADIVNVAHARFAASDRARLDQNLLDRFGKTGARPERAIVVASQVVEQSLDIDFDAVITDLCPVDLLIQRLGRVHRHAGRTRPQPLSDPRCFITGIAEPTAVPPKINGDSVAIYGEHVLLRSLAALQQVCGVPGTLTTPADVPTLVHTVYGTDPIGPADWQPKMAEAAKKDADKQRDTEDLANRWAMVPKLAAGGLDGWLQENDGEADDPDPYNRAHGRVRDGSESIEVLLVLTDGTGWRTLDWLPEHGSAVIPDEGPVPWPVAEAVANSSIRLPFHMSKGRVGDAVIGELEKLGRSNLQLAPLLRGQLILPLHTDEASTHRCTGRVGDWTITYDVDDGLQAFRR
ncbi:CRISPR-associated helicase Cas3' [Brevibacterium sp. 50QC2O2]|uniref:CRISPR-associated helicase Cas3' n=1 Tax=Brevibacterium sp. 50QC2O2 TaxID=2968459 RepID=UPI00211BFD4C|nr:CRISPR-associated helicase Cas3' [Brevibacterium sp. 50QC2O2]MCQ9387259.1 CRISPR-associated helicase Cas3' [Brevibacterium sp. 50QC2O2]